MTTYYHRQTGFIHWLLIPVTAVLVGLAIMGKVSDVTDSILVGVTLISVLFFWHLTVSFDGKALKVRFGPIPLFRTTIFLDEITAAEPYIQGHIR